MRIGLLGGTFDPVHNGHVALAQAALETDRLDKLIIMPSGQPPHKTGQLVSMAGYRHEMACQAFSGYPRIIVSDMEILREGPSYTLDTIRQLRSEMSPDDELILIYGSDILRDIENWHRPAEIMAACPLLLAERGGLDAVDSKAKAEELIGRFGAKTSFFNAPTIDLSSSAIRDAAAAGQAIRQWVPEKVARLIQKHGLYTRQADLTAISKGLTDQLGTLERLVWPLLDRKRLLHSLNVMVYAIHLARIHDVSPEKSSVAALLHDCAKCLPMKETRRYARKMGDDTLLDRELAHGPAGAWLAKTRFGITDPDILRAIHYHTTGCAGMTSLDKIIFIADKVEPARTYENLEEIRRLAEFDLDASLQICLSEIDMFLKRERLTPHPYTGHARDELNRRMSERD